LHIEHHNQIKEFQMSVTTEKSSATTAVRPFTVPVTTETELEALRARVAATRWPGQELVADHSQGPKLAVITELARYWATEYDWRRCEAKLNAVPHFITEIDGLDVHFIHVRSEHANALPVIITHGWPGSIIELLAVIDPLTNPTATTWGSSPAFSMLATSRTRVRLPSKMGCPNATRGRTVRLAGSAQAGSAQRVLRRRGAPRVRTLQPSR
jgi:hypothetical protein